MALIEHSQVQKFVIGVFNKATRACRDFSRIVIATNFLKGEPALKPGSCGGVDDISRQVVWPDAGFELVVLLQCLGRCYKNDLLFGNKEQIPRYIFNREMPMIEKVSNDNIKLVI